MDIAQYKQQFIQRVAICLKYKSEHINGYRRNMVGGLWAYKERTEGKNDLWVKSLKDFLKMMSISKIR
jgi:hypothetical protein